MKNYLLFALLFPFSIAFGQSVLPKGDSFEELKLVAEWQRPKPDAFYKHTPTPPPVPVRHMAEWEELEAIVVTWRGFPQIMGEIVRHAKEEVKVIIVVASAGFQAQAESHLLNSGTTLDNIEFLTAPNESVWIRDYGQNTVYANEVGERYFIDWVYNRINRPNDDLVPQAIADQLGSPIYTTTEAPSRMVHTGGNFMSDGLGTAFSTKLILDENIPGNMFNAGPHDEDGINEIMANFMGIDRFIKFDNLWYDMIHHIDMHMHLMDEETILFGEYPDGVSDGPQIEANIQYLQQNFLSSFESPFDIVRILQPPSWGGVYPSEGGHYRTYTNSVFINKTILVPTYEEQYDSIALRIYKEHFPGYKIVGINCNGMISAYGALHCITKEVGSSDPLWIVHQKQKDIIDNDLWIDYELSATIKHLSGIEEAHLYWSTDTSAGYQVMDMVLENINEDSWIASIPHLENGTGIYYFIKGKSNSGKTQVRPLPAPAAYYYFKVSHEITNTEETAKFNLASIYPNPASALTVIPFENSVPIVAKVELMNTSGKLVDVLFDGLMPARPYSVYFQAGSYPAGIYFINVKSAEGQFTRKLIIN